MSSKSKEKMAAAFRRFFRSSSKPGHQQQEEAVGGQGCSSSNVGSPARRLLGKHGYHRDAVIPSDAVQGLEGPKKSMMDIFKPKKNNSDKAAATTNQKTVRSRRLMKELQEIQRLQHRHDPIFTVELVNDNLFEWKVRLYRIDPESDLAIDMRESGIKNILLHLIFPDNFPFSPPFMRVISPRIEKGFVMEGGAICMELLTPRGWASAYTIEAVIMQFAASIVKGQGRLAKKSKGSKEFNRRSAEESFRSLVKTHEKYGWVTPPLADG